MYVPESVEDVVREWEHALDLIEELEDRRDQMNMRLSTAYKRFLDARKKRFAVTMTRDSKDPRGCTACAIEYRGTSIGDPTLLVFDRTCTYDCGRPGGTDCKISFAELGLYMDPTT